MSQSFTTRRYRCYGVAFRLHTWSKFIHNYFWRNFIWKIIGNCLNVYLQVKEAYINFLNHCYIDTEVEMKEIYTSNHMWSLFEKSFIVDMGIIATATHDREHADTALENYVTGCLMNIITTFFSSPFSDQSTTVQVLYSSISIILNDFKISGFRYFSVLCL